MQLEGGPRTQDHLKLSQESEGSLEGSLGHGSRWAGPLPPTPVGPGLRARKGEAGRFEKPQPRLFPPAPASSALDLLSLLLSQAAPPEQVKPPGTQHLHPQLLPSGVPGCCIHPPTSLPDPYSLLLSAASTPSLPRTPGLELARSQWTCVCFGLCSIQDSYPSPGRWEWQVAGT